MTGSSTATSAGVSEAAALTRRCWHGDSVPRHQRHFYEQISTNFEVGAKGDLMDGRLRLSAALFFNELEGAYFFFYDPNTNTQNLGGVQEPIPVWKSKGRPCWVSTSLNFGLGLTDSEITEAPTEDWLGNQAPLVSEVTGNVGLQFRAPMGGNGLEVFAAPTGRLARNGRQQLLFTRAVDLLDLRAGVESVDNWAVTVWVKNATDEEYNTEYHRAPMRLYLGHSGLKPHQLPVACTGRPLRHRIDEVVLKTKGERRI